MEQQLWHVAWQTLGEWPPHDKRGDWQELAEFYTPLIAAGSVAVSSPLHTAYLGQPIEATFLRPEDAAQLRTWLAELTRDGGDRVAGGHAVLAEAFMLLRVHVLFRCGRERLGQVVGRIKSRLASLLLRQPRWANKGSRLWAKGFWAAEVLDEAIRGKIEAFLEDQTSGPSSGSSARRSPSPNAAARSSAP